MQTLGWVVASIFAVMFCAVSVAYWYRVDQYFKLWTEYQRLQHDICGLYEIAHFPEDMWLPSKEWGEWVWAAMNRMGFLK